MFIWASIENHWDIFFREFPKKKTKRNEYIDHSQINYENVYCPKNRKTFKTKYQSTTLVLSQKEAEETSQ